VINQLPSRIGSGIRELGWQLDEKLVWPASDAIQYEPGGDGVPQDQGGSWWVRHRVDLAIAAVLAVVAFLLRRHGLPTDGLWLDDSLQAAALPASPSDLFAVSADHPGYTALLIGWRALGFGGDAQLAWPTLAAGALGPALLYLALRYCGYERSISVLMGAALAVAATDVVYSGRVKTYTIDVLIVLGLALVIPRLTRMRWTWRIAVAWIAAAAVLAFWSGFGLIAVAVAGPIIVLHPNSDFRLRLGAVAVQESICVVFLAAQNHSHDVGALQDQFRTTWNAFIDFNGPIDFLGDTFVHIRRVGEYFVGSSHWFAAVCIVVAVVGLVVGALRGRQAIRARYLLLLLIAAFIGGVSGKFPFGPSEGYLISSGGRVSLWLIPVVAIGLAAALQGLRGILPGRVPRLLFDAAACIAALVIVVIGLSRDPVAYPFPGAHSATQFIQSQLGEQDAVLVAYRSDWSYAYESGLHSGIDRTPETSVGYQPTFDDPRVHRVDTLTDRAHVAPQVASANRVFVYYAEPPFSDAEGALRPQLTSSLYSLGFRPQPTRTFKDATVQIWVRPGTAPGAGNLTISDLPPGWSLVTPGTPPAGTRILACLGDVPPAAPSVVGATAAHKLNLLSQVNRWSSSAAASRALAAFGSPQGAACTRSALQQTFAAAEIPLAVSVRRVQAPSTTGRHAVAYHVTGRGADGKTPVAGTALFFSRGNSTALINTLRGDGKKSFPSALTANLAATLANRIERKP
jgi:hypothetical protein